MDRLYRDVCFASSRLITHAYSTSFSVGVRCLHRRIRDAVYGIYGFVRLADEIVDTFDHCDRTTLLREFEEEYDRAGVRGISTHPVVNAFRETVVRYGIEDTLIRAFLNSMRMDLDHQTYSDDEIRTYIFGSAEAVGLMCLRVFVEGDTNRYERLAPAACRLGSAFQKINFLRDLQRDRVELHRIYFPLLEREPLCERTKRTILADIYDDFREAERGIRQLPDCARLGVYTAYLYYLALTGRIAHTPAERLGGSRIRVSNGRKVLLLGKAYLSDKITGYGDLRR